MLQSDCTTPEARDAFQARLPRSRDLNGAGLTIVPAYTEAGRYSEANCITVTDGERVAVYAAYSVGEEQSEAGPDDDATRLRVVK